MTTRELLTEARKLPPGKRVRLAHRILATADAENGGALPLWQREILERRLKEDDENPDDVVTWEELKKKLARLARKRR